MPAALFTSYGVASNQPAIGGNNSSGSSAKETVEIAKISDHYNYVDLVAIALLAFQDAAPVCLSRILGMNEFPTIAVSSIYHSLTSGVYETRKRWRKNTTWKSFFLETSERGENKQLLRLSAILALFPGALNTGQFYRKPYGATSSLLVAATLKGLMVVMWGFWPRKAASEERWDMLVCSICGSMELKIARSGDTTPILADKARDWKWQRQSSEAHINT
jgi:hypothetical protein